MSLVYNELDETQQHWLESDLTGRRLELAYDPDKKSFDVEEAQAALEAEQANLIPSPIHRAHPDVPGQGGEISLMERM